MAVSDKQLARAFLAAGARTVVLADLDETAVNDAAKDIGCEGMPCNVTDESQVRQLIATTLERHGQIDLLCSNAGAGGDGVLTDADNAVWQNQWELHVMSHLYAARAALPSMLARGRGLSAKYRFSGRTISCAGKRSLYRHQSRLLSSLPNFWP